MKQNPHKQCGDFLLKDRRGYFTYNCAVVVDDIRQGINLVIRGEDLLHCTGRQLALRRHLGNPTSPLFLHHPLAVDADGKKLSKRTFAEGISRRRMHGDSPEALARLCIWQEYCPIPYASKLGKSRKFLKMHWILIF